MPKWEGQLNKVDDYRWEIPKSYKPGMRVPGLIYADEAMLNVIREEQSLEQVAKSRPIRSASLSARSERM